MPQPPVRLAVPSLQRRGNPWREALFFVIAFLAMFGGALIALDLLAGWLS